MRSVTLLASLCLGYFWRKLDFLPSFQNMNNSDAEIEEVSEIFYNIVRQVGNEENLDPADLANFKKNHVKLLYPHKKYFCCEACGETPGYFCCCTSSKVMGEFVKFGLSVCLYFKFLKHSILFYFFLSLLLILSCVVCYKITQENDINPLEGYSNFLFATTYGAFASAHNKCQYTLLDATGKAKFTISCPYGTINTFASVLSDQSLNSLYNCRNERKKQENNDAANTAATQNRLSSSTFCNVDRTQCTITEMYNLAVKSSKYSSVAYTYECLDNHYKIGALDYNSRYYLYFVVAVDLFFCLFFMVFLRSEIGAEADETDYFKGTQASLNDFSVEIKGFTTSTVDQEFEELIKAIQIIYNQQNLTKSIVSYTFEEDEKLISFTKQKFSIFREIWQLIRDYYWADPEDEHLSFKECHKKVFAGAEGKLRDYSEKLQRLIMISFEVEKQRGHVEASSEDKVSLLLVFDEVNKKRMVKSLIQERCCSRNEIRVGHKTYTIENAPVPDMIIWENKYCWTKLRVFISWVFTLAICVGSYLLFGFIQYKQSQLFTEYNYGIDCSVLYSSAQLATVDATLLSQPNYVTCICKDQGLLSSSSQNSAYCSTWTTQYRLYLVVPLLISLGIVVYNVVVSYLFRWMGYFEKHKFVIDQELSFTLKRAFLLIMNMGLIMILLNYNYNGQVNLEEVSFIFLGKFDDFTADWYQSIGAIITLTLVFNIATPIAEFVLSFILKCLRKCWDTRCWRVPTSSKTKNEYLGLYIDDVFPIGERYAFLIATFFVTFSFSGVLPILVPISAVSFFLLYFSDKLLLFKFFQTPRNYTNDLHNFFLNVLIFGLVSHFALTTYFLTEPTMLATDSTINYYITSNTRVNAMLTTVYVYPYLALIAIIVLYFVLTTFCGSLLSTLHSCLCKREDDLLERVHSYIKQDINLWKTLTKLQVEMLLKVSQHSLEKYRLKQQGGIDALMNKEELAATTYTETNATRIMDNAIGRLSQISTMFDDRGRGFNMLTVLIGLPSYDVLAQDEKLASNNYMVKMETQLKHFYKNKFKKAEENSRASPTKHLTPNRPDNSAANLYSDVI